MDRTITSQDYQEMKEIVNKELVLTKDKLVDLQQQTSPFKTYLEKEVPLLENLLEYYRKSDGATPVFTEPIQLIFRISEGLGSSIG